MSNRAFFFIFFFLWQNPLNASYIEFVEPPAFKQSFDVSLQSEFFRSNSNYTNWTEFVRLPENHFFYYFMFLPKVSYSPSHKHGIRLNAFAETFYASSETPRQKKSANFKWSLLGGSLSAYHKIQSFFIGAKLKGAYSFHSLFLNQDGFTLYETQNPLPEEIIVGESTHYFEPSLEFIFKPNSYFSIYNRNAFRYRFNGLSSLVFADLGAVAKSENISAGLSLNTFFSLFFLDSFSNNPQARHQALTNNNAGSLKFYSVNPSVIALTAWLNFNYNFFNTKFYFNSDTLGQNYGKGLTLGFVTHFSFQRNEKTFLDQKRNQNIYMDFNPPAKKSRIQKKKSYFQEEEDPYTEENDDLSDDNLELRQELQLLNE